MSDLPSPSPTPPMKFNTHLGEHNADPEEVARLKREMPPPEGSILESWPTAMGPRKSLPPTPPEGNATRSFREKWTCIDCGTVAVFAEQEGKYIGLVCPRCDAMSPTPESVSLTEPRVPPDGVTELRELLDELEMAAVAYLEDPSTRKTRLKPARQSVEQLFTRLTGERDKLNRESVGLWGKIGGLDADLATLREENLALNAALADVAALREERDRHQSESIAASDVLQSLFIVLSVTPAKDEDIVGVVRSLRSELDQMKETQLTAEEAAHVDENAHIPHKPVCKYWEDKVYDCDCMASRIYAKLARSSSRLSGKQEP